MILPISKNIELGNTFGDFILGKGGAEILAAIREQL
jgi:hypothetical protein